MAIAVYKKGNKHLVNGVPCEIVLCIDVSDMNAQLENGCVHDEKELLVSEEKESSEEINPIRLAAKEAGIEGWETKRIKTLQALLDGTTEG